MDIVHVLKHTRRANGSVHMVVDLACEQAREGHDRVFVVAGPGDFDTLLRSHGVHVVTIHGPFGVRAGLRQLAALLRIVRRSNGVVLHAHMMSSALVAAAASAITRAPLITTMHNSFDRHSGLMRVGRKVVAVSAAERGDLIARGFPARKVVTVLNGTGGSAREEIGAPELPDVPGPSIMALSGLHPRKAVGDVISAFARLHAEFPEWHLNIVGWGPDRAALGHQAAGSGAADRIHFFGATTAPMAFLAATDVFVTASLADPCPLTVMEARTAGCAIVGTSVGGIPEVLDHGEAGLLVPPHDPERLAASLRRLIGDPAELRRWRAASVSGAEQFSVRRMTDDHRKVYESVQGNRPSRPKRARGRH